MKEILKRFYINSRRIFLLFLKFLLFSKLNDFEATYDFQKILFIRIDRIGDLVLSTPALKTLKQAFPNCELTILVSRMNHPIIVNNPYVDHIIVYDNRWKLRAKWDCINRLRRCNFDLAIDPYPGYELTTALIAFLSRAKQRIGYASYGRELFFNLQSPKIKNNQHFVDLTLDILKPLGIEPTEKKPEIFLTETEKSRAINWLKENRIENRPITGIHPGAYYESQRWPVEKFAELATMVQKELKVNLIIFGSPGDYAILDQILSMSDGNIFAYITDDLRKFLALVSNCRILVCNNSGPLHMAVALNVPTISTMGPTNRNRWMPIGDKHKVLRVDDLPCIGCGLGYCKIITHDCMGLITTHMVLETVKKMFNNRHLN